MDLKQYLDQAKTRQGLRSDSMLAKRLDMNHASVSFMRSGKTLPSDSTMLRIAELSGQDARQALLDLAIWRSKDAATRSVYTEMLKDLKSSLKRPTAAILTGAMALTALSISGAPSSLKVDQPQTHKMYIM